MFIEAARARGEALDHVLLAGPPGPRQDLARADRGRRARGAVRVRPRARPWSARPTWPATSRRSSRARCSSWTRSTGCRARSRRPSIPAMEDRRLPITVGQGAGARVVTLDLPAFTLIGATTRAGPAHHAAARPLRRHAPARPLRTRPSSRGSSRRSAGILGVEIDDEGAVAIATRSRGTPRVANRLLKRVRDFAEVRGAGHIDGGVAREALDMLEVDEARARPSRPRDPEDHLREVRAAGPLV